MRPRDREQLNETPEIAWTHSARTPLDPPNLNSWDSSLEESENLQIVVIERRALMRECLTRSLRASSGYAVLSFPSVESWLEVSDTVQASLVVLCTGTRIKDAEIRREVSLLSNQKNPLPIILLSDVEDPDQIVEALDQGARGYIPTSVPLEVAVEAMRLVRAGGVFVPASSLIAARRSTDDSNGSKRTGHGLFTARQAAVVEALRRGKANKVIAYELNMRESTVKVHVRNIMKKLRARNRTEVAYMANSLMHPDSEA
jgi:DNA-binding NarL/FixJ family response regulator